MYQVVLLNKSPANFTMTSPIAQNALFIFFKPSEYISVTHSAIIFKTATTEIYVLLR